MARINIEDKWWSDPRRNRLIEKLGNPKLVDGLMIQLWRYAQNNSGEPFEWKGILEEKEVQALACVGLCSLVNSTHIYIKGSKEAFNWLQKCRVAGKKGGKAGTGSNKNRYLAQALARVSKLPTPTLPLTPILSQDPILKNCKVKNFADEKPSVSEIGKTFKEAYKKAYGKEYPAWGAKENSQIKKWLASVGYDRALKLAEAYPFWNDPFVSKRGHPLWLLITNYVALDAHIEKPNAVFKKISDGKKFETEQLEKAQNDFKKKISIEDLEQLANKNNEVEFNDKT